MLTASLPESSGDTLSLAMLATSGELIVTDSRQRVPGTTMAIIFLAAISPALKSIINALNHSLLSTYFEEFSRCISNSMKYTLSLLLLFLLHAGDQLSSLIGHPPQLLVTQATVFKIQPHSTFGCLPLNVIDWWGKELLEESKCEKKKKMVAQ